MLVSCAKETIINQTDESENNTESESLKEDTEKQTEKQTEDNSVQEPKDEPTDDPSDDPTDEPADDPTEEPKIVEPTMNVTGKISKWSLDSGICKSFKTADTPANTKFEVNIPVTEAGSYKLSFKTNLGLTRTFTSGSKKASLSVPKTVFQVGEPIPVAYSSSGLDSSVDARPWIAITKNVSGLDKYISWEYVEANCSYSLNAAAMTGQREDNTVKSYINLPAGEYKIHFIAGGAANTRNTKYWLLSEPINISIVEKGSNGTTVTRSGTAYGSASLTVANNIFVQGESVYIDFTANNLKTPYSNYQPWVGISKTFDISGTMQDYYTHWDYTNTTQNGTFKFDSSTGNYAQGGVSVNVEAYRTLPEGSYKVHYANGSDFQDCINYVEPIGINVAPKATLNASVGNKSVLSTDNPYDNKFVDETITVTEADAANGYVTVSFSFGSLKAATDYFLTVDNVSLVKQ